LDTNFLQNDLKEISFAWWSIFGAGDGKKWADLEDWE
jgi:hypothetical protein